MGFMKRLLFLSLFACSIVFSYAQEGTKQFMPNSNDRLWLEFGAFTGNNFGLYDCDENERINVYLKANEKLYLGMKMNTSAYGGSGYTNTDRISFRIIDPDGQVFYPSTTMITSGSGYIANYTQAITGPNGAVLNGTAISGGYTPIIIPATKEGNYSIEFQSWRYSHSTYGDNAPNYRLRRRFALELFDVTVTDASNNVVTNPGEPNKSAGRLWSKGWSFTTTSFTEYPVNAHFFVFTSDEFINKVNFQLYPYSFTFVANHYGVTTLTDESHYIRRTQSLEDDQTVDGIQEYRVFLNDPDRIVWPNTTLAPPRVQVWAEEELFFDYSYNRDPLYLPIDYSNVILEKNEPSCLYDDVTFFKIESNLDGYTAILIDVDNDGEYSSDGNDRVIYRDMRKGLNYILWDFKKDNGAEVANGTYSASATFLGRGPAHFPLYDVERLDGITTSSIRPFNKLQTTLYWDDTQISRWGDETGAGQMDATQQKQLVVDNHVDRIWSWNAALEDEFFNGNKNTMNTWFNAIDLGYGDIGIEVQESDSKCVDGSAPWVGDVYIEGPKNQTIVFDIDDFDYKFFHPNGIALSSVQVVTLPSEGSLFYNGNPVTLGQEIARGNVGLITYVPPADYHGKTSFIWKGRDSNGNWSNNQENVYLIINTPPTISPIDDQQLCTNSTTNQIDFTVSDAETAANELIVTGFSAFPEFVPHSGIVISGTGENRSVTVNPVANKSGEAIIYIMVDDGLSQVIEEFSVTVSPSLEFTGDTIVCVDDPLYLVAEEFGADSYSWKFNGTEISDGQSVQQDAGSVSIGEWTLTIEKTVEGNTCVSTRTFNVEVSPLTTFFGDVDVCVGEEISLTATEVNATSYIWRKGTTTVSTQRAFTKSSAALGDAGDNYTLYVDKNGCQNTSQQFSITVKNLPNTGLTVTGSTVDPGKDGTISIQNTEADVSYNVYKGGSFVTSGAGPGNIDITIDASNLQIGSNEFTLFADNGNCSIEFPQPVYITVNQPAISVSPLTLTTTEGGSTVNFTVVLETEPSQNVVIPISSNDTSEGTVSPTSLTFTPANWNTPQQVTITPVRDWEIDGNQTYSVILSAATGTDPHYSGMDADDVTVTNNDVDIAGVTITGTSLQTTEAGATDQFTLVLTARPSADVVISFSGVNTNEGLLSASSITFTPANWDSPQAVVVTGQDDDIDDGDAYYTINMSSASGDGNFDGLSITSVNVVNYDDDTAELIVSENSITTSEDGAFATFTIALGTQPTATTTIIIGSSDTSEGQVNFVSLTFTTTDWATPKQITVTGQNDDIVDGDINYTVTVQGTSGDASYIGLSHLINAVNTDNDVAELWVSKSTLSTSEPNVADNFTVRLTAQPASNIEVSVGSSDLSEASVSPSILTFTPANWNSTQTVTVTGADDDIIDGEQSYTVSLLVTNGDGIFDGVSESLAGLNADNDAAGIELSQTSITTSEDGTDASFGVRLTAEPASNVVLSISGLDATEGSISTTSLTFTPANWDIYQNVTVTGEDDEEEDGNQTYDLTLAYASGDVDFASVSASVQVTNIDDDEAGITVSPQNLTITEGNGANFSISLSSQPTNDVTISISSPDVNELTVSQSSVTFTPANWVPRQITVNAIDDNVDDGDLAYTITLSNAVSGDANYSGMPVGDVTVNITDIHTAGITVSSASANTTEAGGTATFTVVLNTKPTANVTITSALLDATEGVVTTNGSISFSAANWDTPQQVTVRGVDDDIDDGDQAYQVSVQVSSADLNYGSALNTFVDFTNEDDDTAGVTVTPTSGLETNEGGGTASFTVQLNTEPTRDVTLSFVSDNTDEGAVSQASLVFNSTNWNNPRSINLIGQDDDVADGPQSYSITISASSEDLTYNGIAIQSVSATNLDDDVVGVNVSAISGNTTELGGTAIFTVSLNSQPTNSVTISSASNDATEGTVSANSTIVFNSSNWSTPQTVTVRGVNDFVADGDIAYTVSLSASSSDAAYNNIAIGNVNVVNEDDDVVGLILSTGSVQTSEPDIADSFTVTLQSQPTAGVTINISSTDESEGIASPATLNFNATNWDTPQTVTVTGQDDDMVDGTIAYQIIINSSSSADLQYAALANETVTAENLDDDVAGISVAPYAGLSTNEAGGTAQFSVVLNTRPQADVSIRMTSSDTAEGVITNVSRGSFDIDANEAFVTFTPDQWNSPVTGTVTGIDDSYDDGDKAYSIITEIPQTTDPHYSVINPRDVSLTNLDDDSWGLIISPSTLTVNEDGASQSFSITLTSQPTHDVEIPLYSTNAARLTVSHASVTFNAASATDWQTPKVITVTPVNNQIDEGDEEITIVTDRIISADVNYGNYNPSNVTVQFIEDDEAAINVSPISGNTTEGGGQATFTLVLNSQPTADVTIGISSSNIDEGTALPASVTFTPLNWNVEQTVTVTGVDDAAIDGNVVYYIEFANAVSADLTYDEMVIPSVEVVNEDDDSAGVSVFPISGLVTNEAGQTATFTVRLNTIPTHDVTISVVSSNETEGTVLPAMLTFTSGNWNVPQTVTITGVDDLVDDGNQSYTINLAIESTGDVNYQPVSIQSVAVTNNDDVTPRPNNDAATTDQENSVTIDVLSNDLGLDYAPVTVSVISQPAQGTAVANADNTVTYTPNRYYHGDFTFTYTVCNSLGNCAEAQVTVTVDRVNVVPIANSDFRGTSMNTPVDVDVLFNDDNLYDIPLTVTVVGSASPSGSLEVTAENTVIFTPAADYVGEATFTYRVTDNDGEFDEALVTITVREENHTPVANNDNVTVIKNTPETINVLANDSGLDDGFGSMSIHIPPSSGSVVINDNRTVTYSPNPDFVGNDSFEYFIEDIDGDYDLATVQITVIDQPNAVPVAFDDSRATEMDTPITVDVLFNDTDLDDGVDALNIASSPSNGIVVVNPDFTITYTPNSGYLGTETFRYQVCDVDGDCSNTALVTIIVKPTGTNHNPVAADDEAITYVNTSVDIDVLANDSGLEDGFGSIEVYQQQLPGNAEVIEGNLIRFTPANFYIGNVTFTYKLSDIDGDYDIATVSVGIFDENNPKPVANDDRVGTSFNTLVTIDVLANDTDLDDEPITVTVLTEPNVAEGSASVNPDNTIDFTPATDFAGVVTFSYLVTDANGDTDDATVEVTVKSGENFVPIANDDSRGTSFNTPVVVDVLENDLNLIDEPITVSISVPSNPAFGEALVNGDNTITFTPATDYIGLATFVYSVTDADGDSDNALVSITVKDGENIVPIAQNDVAFTHMETSIDIDVLANDTGLDDSPITIYVNSAEVNNGEVEVTESNQVRFTPAIGFVGETVFAYRVVDVDGDFDEATVTVNVYHEVIAINDEAEVMRNEEVTINVLANDQGIESIIPELTITYMPTHGMVTVNADNSITYTPDFDYFGDDSFEYRVCSQYGSCSDAEVSIDVKIEKFKIPEGFSPDGDGINDKFEIIGIEAYNQVTIKIYNRWGNLVYLNTNYKNNWDGKASASMSVGKTLPTGTYYYIIEIVDTKEKFSGNVFLKR